MFKSIKKHWRTIAAAVVSYYTFGIASGWIAGSGFLSGAVAGGAAGFMGGAVATGTLKGALQGAFTGAFFGGLGGHLSNASTSVQVGVHSLAGGVVSKLQGGNFGHGFFSAGFTKWAGKTWHIDTGSARNVIGNSLKQAIIGGTASKITGNKFSNGAFTAALQYIVNEAGSQLAEMQRYRVSERLTAQERQQYLRSLGVDGEFIGEARELLRDMIKAYGKGDRAIFDVLPEWEGREALEIGYTEVHSGDGLSDFMQFDHTSALMRESASLAVDAASIPRSPRRWWQSLRGTIAPTPQPTRQINHKQLLNFYEHQRQLGKGGS